MYPRHRRLAVIFAATLASVLPLIGHAALPPSVDGQPLPSLAPMLEKVTPAVVNISTKTRVKVRDPFFDDPVFRQMFGLNGGARERVEQSLGSGVIVDAAKGYVLTNNHVVGSADDITVTLQDGRNFKGKLIGTDPETDVAVVQIQGTDLKALPLANSDQLRVGDFVVAVGDPFGLGQTATSGIVSALRRSGLGNSGYQNFIQTDASINPGNSGGALVNLRGELVGINTMIFSPSGGNVGIGFAIPTNLSSEVMQQLIAHGKVSRGTLGIDTQEITPRIAQVLGLKNSNGVVVTRVSNGSVADQADVQTGDVITAIDGKPVTSQSSLTRLIYAHPSGSTLTVRISRNGQPMQVQVGTKESGGHPVMGVEVTEQYQFPFQVKISVGDIGGPSAGMMFALGIIDKLTKLNLTGGKFIAGTGEITASGQVQPIGGIQQKMVGARNAGATVFLTPASNCADTKGAVPAGLRLVKVSTLTQAVDYLEDLRSGQPVPSC